MHRRTLRSGPRLAGMASLGGWAYRSAPTVWKICKKDLRRRVAPSPSCPNPKAWPDHGLYAAWVGHSTVLLKIDGYTVITDPVFSTRVGPHLGIGTVGLKRLVAPALPLGELPRIDLVLLSHAHFDHFDLATLRRLESRGTRVVTAPHTSDLLRVNRYGDVRELAWGERAALGPFDVRAFEVNHWGARVRRDTWRGYNGYILAAGRYRVLFGGDTAMTGAFRTLRSTRRFDLAIMPVGAYNPWVHCHCTPEQAWKMANDAGAEFFLPVHHQTFALSREPYHEPIERLCDAAGNSPDRVALRRIGEQFQLSHRS